MAKRKMDEKTKNILKNDFVIFFKRFIKENNFKINLFTLLPQVNNKLSGVKHQFNLEYLKSFEDIIELEILWYESGGCTSSYFQECLFNDFKTRKSRIIYCLTFFLEDLGVFTSTEIINIRNYFTDIFN